MFFTLDLPDELKMKKNIIRGSMIGGAAGDALGYAAEFISLEKIRGIYGQKGITEYNLDKKTGKAFISDDTQMALFTANGILCAETERVLCGTDVRPSKYMLQAYQDWLLTQLSDYETECDKTYKGISWLLNVPELYNWRAPGNTCLSALRTRIVLDDSGTDYIDNPINSSKGCGGIMRIAPMGLFYGNMDIEEVDKEAAVISAITHSHSLGYISSSVLAHILNRIVYPKIKSQTLISIVLEAKDTVCTLFSEDEHLPKLTAIIDKAIEFSENDRFDEENIQALGRGSVAEETLAIALYCSLKYEHDFSAGLIASVNHNGDSDSTGAVTGNILGALVGFDEIEDKWKENLELYDTILEIADDMCVSSMEYNNDNWKSKYLKTEREG